MSSGDIDNHLAPISQLERLWKVMPGFYDYCRTAWLLIPIRSFFIPYGAGISTNGQRVYVSHDIQSIVEGVECENCLVRHETTEWAAREFLGIGEDYLTDPSGHRLGNRAEHDRCLELLNREDAWEVYSEVIDSQVLLDGRIDIKDRPVPQDLALYPYEDDIRDKLVEAMLNSRSQEEWSKLYGD